MILRRSVVLVLVVVGLAFPAHGEMVRAWDTTVLDSSYAGFRTAKARRLADDSLMVVGTEVAGLTATRFDASGAVLSQVVLQREGSYRVDVDPFGVVAAVGRWQGVEAVFLFDGLTGRSLWEAPFVLAGRVGAQETFIRLTFASNGDVFALVMYGPAYAWDLAALRLGRRDGAPLWPGPATLTAGAFSWQALGMALAPTGDLVLTAASDSGLHVQVYDGGTGRPRWTAPAAYGGRGVVAVGDPGCDGAGNVFVAVGDFDRTSQRTRWVTLSYAASTGAERWRAVRDSDWPGPRFLLAGEDGRVLVAGEESGRIAAVRYSASGSALPEVSWPALPSLFSSWTLAQAFSEGNDDVILVAAEGWATRRSAVSGRELWTRRLRFEPGPSQIQAIPAQYVRGRDGSFTITAYEGHIEKVDSATGVDAWPAPVEVGGSVPAPAYFGFLRSRPNGDAVVGSQVSSTAWRLEGGTGAQAGGWPASVPNCYPSQMAMDVHGDAAFLCVPHAQPLRLVVAKLDGNTGGAAWSAPTTVGDATSGGASPLLLADPAGDFLVSQAPPDDSFRVVKVRGGDGTVAWSTQVLPIGKVYVPRALAADATGNVAISASDHLSDAWVTKVKGTDGSPLWPKPFTIPGGGNQGDFLGMGVDAGGSVFVAAYVPVVSRGATGYVCRLWKLNGSDGTPVWSRDFSTPIFEGTLAVGSSGDVYVVTGQSYYPTSLLQTYAVTRLSGADGSPVWPLPFVVARNSTGSMSASLKLRANGNAVVHLGFETWELEGSTGAALWGPLPGESYDSFSMFDLTPDGLTMLGWTGDRRGRVVHFTTSLAVDPGAFGISPARCSTPYSHALAARNAAAPVAWSVSAGALPPGIALDPSGVLSGSSSVAGTYRFRVRVADASGAAAERDLSLDVVCDGVVSILGGAAAPCGIGRTLSVPGTWSSYLWLPGGETTPTITVTPRTRSTYGVVVTDASGSTSHGSVDVDVMSLPAPVVTAPPFVAAGDRRLTASVPPSGANGYVWNIRGGAIGSGQGTSTITFEAGRPGTLWLDVAETESAGCAVTPGYASVAVNPVESTFNVLPPCRLLDTREPGDGPRLQAKETRLLIVAGRCGIPATARTAVLNVTAVYPAGTGSIAVLPGDAPEAAANTVTFRLRQTRASLSVVPLAVDGSSTIAIRNDSSGGVDVVLDVTGWFE